LITILGIHPVPGIIPLIFIEKLHLRVEKHFGDFGAPFFPLFVAHDCGFAIKYKKIITEVLKVYDPKNQSNSD
jgi:hypothetical protein